MIDSGALRPRIAGEHERDLYDDFVARSPFADVLQSFAWGEVKRTGGWVPHRILVQGGHGIVAAAQVLETRPVRGAPPILYCPRGPVLDYRQPEALGAILAEVERRAGKAILLKCDPPIPMGIAEAGALAAAGFRPSGAGRFGGVQPRAVMVLDLAPGIDSVHEGFHKKWKYNIRLAERKGVEVSEAGRDELPVFYDLLLETARRDHFLIRGREYFERLVDVLTPAGRLAMFLARYEGRAIAGAMLLTFGSRATYTYGASSSRDRNVMPNHLLQWTMIRWAHDRGFQTYDFRGVSPMRNGKPTEEHLAGLNRFKAGFGARYVEYVGELDLPLRSVMYRGWRYGAPVAMRALKALRGSGGSLAD